MRKCICGVALKLAQLNIGKEENIVAAAMRKAKHSLTRAACVRNNGNLGEYRAIIESIAHMYHFVVMKGFYHPDIMQK